MTILVTGAGGFIGSHLVQKFTSEKKSVVATLHDYVENKWLKYALKDSVRVRGDIRDSSFVKRVLNQYDITRVYHLAAQSIVKSAWKDPINTFDINVMGTVNILQNCKQLGIKEILVQSTDKVYGNKMGAKTSDRLLSTEPYGTSKICSDVIAQSFNLTYGMKIKITRSCNVFGYDWNNRIIPNTIRACLQNKSPIIFKNDQSKRQYIFIEDLLNAFKKIATLDLYGPINIATDIIKNQEEVVLEILTNFPDIKPRYVEKPRLQEIHSQSMRSTIQFDTHSFPAAIKKTIEKYRRWEK